MENLFLCEVELRSLADLEKFGNIINNDFKCDNIPKLNTEEIARYIKGKDITCEVVVTAKALAELKKWFYVDNVKESVCLNGKLYTLY